MKPGTLVLLPQAISLGAGRVVDVGPDETVMVRLPMDGESLSRQVSALERFPLHAGQRLRCPPLSDTVVEVIEVDHGDDLRRCHVVVDGRAEVLPESLLEPLVPSLADPVSFLESLCWDAPHHFFARLALTCSQTVWYTDTEGIPTFRGARVRPLAHQLYAARRILEDRAPRFILADEVGLGKTIEAGLVIQALLSTTPRLRVLVLAPGSMSRQWQRELYLRFGGHVFAHITGAGDGRVSRRLLGDPDESKVIVSTAALAAEPALREAVLAERWDLVVVDEAHQIPPSHPLHATLTTLATRSDGFLALSATPSKREMTGLTGLLALIAPDAWRVDDTETLERRFEERRAIWAVLQATTSILEAARADGADGALDRDTVEFIVEDWQQSLDGDPVVEQLLDRARGGDVGAFDELVAYAQEHHRFDHRIVRTRRRTLDTLGMRFPERERCFWDYTPSAPEALLAEHAERLGAAPPGDRVGGVLRRHLLRALSTTPRIALHRFEARAAALEGPTRDALDAIAAALASDPGPAEEEALSARLLAAAPSLPGEGRWLDEALGLAREWLRLERDGCARHRALIEALGALIERDAAARILVFAQTREVVLEAAKLMQTSRPRWRVGVFHHGLDEGALEQVALRFQRGDLHVLVSDELGGEGRNFQIADAVVHLDTPEAVARIEQRIGRLDRMGRAPDRPVRSCVMRGPLAVERGLQSLHDDVFAVYTRTVGGLEFALPRLQMAIDTALGLGLDLHALASRLGEDVRATREAADEDFETALDTASHHLKQAGELAGILADWGGEDADDEQRTLRHWLGTLGVRSRRDGRTVCFEWQPDRHETGPSALGTTGWVTTYGTFDREQALERESLQYFAPGHWLVNAAVAELSTSLRGRATVLMRDLGRAGRGAVFVVVLGMGRLRRDLWGPRGMSAGLVTRARRFLGPNAGSTCVRIELDGGRPPTLVRDHALREALVRVFRRDDGDESVPVSALARVDLAALWRAVRAGVELGLAAQQAELDALRDEALAALGESWRTESGYLRGQLRRGTAEARRAAEAELAQRERLVESIRRATVASEGVAVVFGKG